MLPLSSPPTAPTVLAHPSPPPFEVADIVRAYGAAFRATHAVSHEQARVLRAIAQCRTAALGGHVEQCVSCGTERVCYDSCRNRHCPKCQGSARAKWLAAEQALLLPIPYFHVVFTLPHHLNPLIRVNQRRPLRLVIPDRRPDLAGVCPRSPTSGRRNRHYGGASHLGPDLDRAYSRALRGHGRRPESRRHAVARVSAPLSVCRQSAWAQSSGASISRGWSGYAASSG